MTLWTAIPWPVFATAWFLTGAALYIWMTGPWALALLAIPVFAVELFIGNVHLLLALAIVLGFRWPATWSFVLLTKVTPGIGLLWFAVRREWRSLAIALGATAVIAAVSCRASSPACGWTGSARWVRPRNPVRPTPSAVPLPVRVAAAAVIVDLGRPDRPALDRARRRRRLSLPVLWLNGFAMLAGIVALHRGFPERLHGQFDWMTAWLPRPAAAARPVGHRAAPTTPRARLVGWPSRPLQRTRPIDPVFVVRAVLSVVGLFMIWLVVSGVLTDPPTWATTRAPTGATRATRSTPAPASRRATASTATPRCSCRS